MDPFCNIEMIAPQFALFLYEARRVSDAVSNRAFFRRGFVFLEIF